jgi:hypothetical protein
MSSTSYFCDKTKQSPHILGPIFAQDAVLKYMGLHFLHKASAYVPFRPMQSGVIYARVGVALGSDMSLRVILTARFTPDPRDDEIVLRLGSVVSFQQEKFNVYGMNGSVQAGDLDVVDAAGSLKVVH